LPVFQLFEDIVFPPVNLADEDGLLAVGGDLSIERLKLAYSNGIFPWFNEGEPILWWSPNPRCVLFPKDFKTSKSMKQHLRKNNFKISFDSDFEAVIRNCQEIERKGQDGTWITQDVINAYLQLHVEGYAHSVEVWDLQGELIGGIYGVSFGKVFFGESMFSKKSNASKTAMFYLVQKLLDWEFEVIDCQIHNSHLESLGAVMIDGELFQDILNKGLAFQTKKGNWIN